MNRLHLPNSIDQDKNVKEISRAIDEELARLNRHSEHLLLLKNLSKLSDELLDELAYQYHVDFYSDRFDKATKVELIRTAIQMHKLKGTPKAVEDVCRKVYADAVVEENWQYGGKPYHFRVRQIKGRLDDEHKITEISRAINSTKNVRSWIDDIGFSRKSNMTIYVAAVCKQTRKYKILPTKFTMPDQHGKVYVAGYVKETRKVVIK